MIHLTIKLNKNVSDFLSYLSQLTRVFTWLWFIPTPLLNWLIIVLIFLGSNGTGTCKKKMQKYIMRSVKEPVNHFLLESSLVVSPVTYSFFLSVCSDTCGCGECFCLCGDQSGKGSILVLCSRTAYWSESGSGVKYRERENEGEDYRDAWYKSSADAERRRLKLRVYSQTHTGNRSSRIHSLLMTVCVCTCAARVCVCVFSCVWGASDSSLI